MQSVNPLPNVFELLALYKMAMRDCEGLDEKIL